MRTHRMWARCATHSCQITLPVVRSEDHWCGCNILVHWCRGHHSITGAGAAYTTRADVVCTARAGALHVATGAGVVVVDTYTGAGAAYAAGAGAVYWAATYSGTCTAASSPTRCATGQRHFEREFLVAPHGAQSALSSPLCAARAAVDLHGQPPGLSSKATQERRLSKTASGGRTHDAALVTEFFFHQCCAGASKSRQRRLEEQGGHKTHLSFWRTSTLNQVVETYSCFDMCRKVTLLMKITR